MLCLAQEPWQRGTGEAGDTGKGLAQKRHRDGEYRGPCNGAVSPDEMEPWSFLRATVPATWEACLGWGGKKVSWNAAASPRDTSDFTPDRQLSRSQRGRAGNGEIQVGARDGISGFKFQAKQNQKKKKILVENT